MNRSSFVSTKIRRLMVSFVLFLVAGAVAADEGADFTLPDINGEIHQLSDYRGQWVVVNYWATWCPPCLEEIPELVLFHEQHSDTDAVVLGINYEQVAMDKLETFIDDYQISYPVLKADPAEGSPLGDVIGLPTTYIVSPEGEVVARQMGGITADMIEQFMAEAGKSEKPDKAI